MGRKLTRCIVSSIKLTASMTNCCVQAPDTLELHDSCASNAIQGCLYAVCACLCRSAQPPSLPVPRNRRRWNLEQAPVSEAAPATDEGQQAAGQGQGQVEGGLVPLSVVMDVCMAQGILEQYRCVSKACLGYV